MKYFFHLKRERNQQAIKAANTDGHTQCTKCERWGFFCKCE